MSVPPKNDDSLCTRLSARHFLPKFDNLKSTEPDPVSLMTSEDILLVTKKHSGSLILLHAVLLNNADPVNGWALVINSKNGTNNEFSIAAEHYIRAQFRGVFGEQWNVMFTDFVAFLGLHSFTFCFEFVTSFLGDHGEKPNMPYAVLTTVSQFCEAKQESRFASLPEMVELASRFRLILNEMWVISAKDSVRVSGELHAMRWTGEDDEFTTYLDSECECKVHSMLPHNIGQGQLLEGLVVQVCRASTDTLSEMQENSRSLLQYKESLQDALRKYGEDMSCFEGSVLNLPSFSPPTHTSSVSDVKGFLSAHSSGCDPISLLFADVKELGSKLRFISLKVVERCQNKSVIVHVHQDQIFFDYARGKIPAAADLYRGMEVFIQRVVPVTPISEESSNRLAYTIPGLQWKILGISKWKNWQYLRRTFCMRNTLSTLFRSGHDAFMSIVLRQFQNWGLPRQHYDINRALISCWGKWMLVQDDSKKKFMTDSNKFSYLSYLERFLPQYNSGSLNSLLVDESEKKNITLFVLYFEVIRPDWLEQVTSGYEIREKHKLNKNSPYLPGVAYIMNGKLPKLSDCKSPFCILVAPPSDECIDRRILGMYDQFLFSTSEMKPRPLIFEIRNELQLPEMRNQLEVFEKTHVPKRVFLIAYLGLPPGSGKSTMSAALLDSIEKSSLRGTIVSSDHFGMIHGAGSSSAKTEFECAVVSALTSGADVVIFDKNIPSMSGYDSMRTIAARAALPKLTIVPLVPREITPLDLDLFLRRVLTRPPGSHTLTADSEIPGFSSVDSFVSEVFGNPCLNFVPVAQLLPGSIVLDNMFESGTEDENANFIVGQLINWNSVNTHSSGFNLSTGDYLGLCFDLDDETKTYIEEAVGMPIRKLLHATVVYYRKDPARMAEAARLLKTINTLVPLSVELTRIGMVKGDAGTLCWGSLRVPGFETEPMHATLIADGYPAVFARAGEMSFHEKKFLIGEEEVTIQKIDIDSMTFDAWWGVC